MSENLKKAGDEAITGRNMPSVGGTPDMLIDELRDRVAFLERELRTLRSGPGTGEEVRAGPSHGPGRDEQALPAAYQSLAEKSRYIEAFFSHTVTPLVLLDRDFNFIRVNKAYARACQKEAGEFPGHNHFELYPSDARAIFEDVVRSRQPVQVAARPFVFPDHPEWGVTYWNWTLTPLLDGRGEVEALIFSLEDVTARKRAEIEMEGHRNRLQEMVGEQTRDLEAANDRLLDEITDRKRAEDGLRESEERLRLAQEVARIGTFEWNIQTGVNTWTPELEAMYGLPKGGFPGTQPAWEQLVCHEDRARIVGAVSEAIEKGGFEGEWRVIWPDGSVHWLYGRGFVFKDNADKPLKLVGVNIDITHRKRAEEALREGEARFRAIFEQAAVGMAMVSLDGRFMRVNRKFCDITGYPYQELIGLGPGDITHPDDLPEEQRQIGRLLAGEASTFTSEKRYVRKDGTIIWINLTVVLVYKDGKPAYFSGVTEDITGRRRAEEALRKGEASLARAQAIARLASWEVDVRTNRVQGSGELYRMFNLKPDISLDTYIAKFHPDDRATVVEAINAAIYEGKRYRIDYRIVPRPGDVRHVHADGEVTYDDNGVPVKLFGTVQDITDRKQIEEELKVAKQQAELYLDLMGHDINNMHQIALGYLELARDMPAGGRQAGMIEKPIEVLQRSARLIRNVRKLQNFSDGLLQEQDVDICRVLSQVQREFGAVPRKAVALNLNGIDHCHVRADELLNDVFVNLVSNAIKHTGDRADVVISLEMVDDGGRHCRVTVEDDGPGIPDDFKDKIFNRLLKSTSKAKGMGLGLYLVKSLVDSYGGKVWVEDRVPGDYTRGARFVVILPVA